MKLKVGVGMKALQDRVADRIIKYGQKADRTTTKLIRMRPEFKMAAYKASNRAGLSFESYVRVAIAEKMKWEGKI